MLHTVLRGGAGDRRAIREQFRNTHSEYSEFEQSGTNRARLRVWFSVFTTAAQYKCESFAQAVTPASINAKP